MGNLDVSYTGRAASDVPGMPGGTAASVVKNGQSDVGNKRFGEMLDTLATKASAPSGSKPASTGISSRPAAAAPAARVLSTPATDRAAESSAVAAAAASADDTSADVESLNTPGISGIPRSMSRAALLARLVGADPTAASDPTVEELSTTTDPALGVETGGSKSEQVSTSKTRAAQSESISVAGGDETDQATVVASMMTMTAVVQEAVSATPQRGSSAEGETASHPDGRQPGSSAGKAGLPSNAQKLAGFKNQATATLQEQQAGAADLNGVGPDEDTDGEAVAVMATGAVVTGGAAATLATNNLKRESLAEDAGQHAKLTRADAVAGNASNVSQASAGLPTGDAKADMRQRGGDRPTESRIAPNSLPPTSASSFASQVSTGLSAVSSTTAATTATAAAATSVSQTASADSELQHQIVQAVRMQWNQGMGTAHVTLHPEYLGDLSIDIRVDHGVVTAVLDASSPTVRQWLEGHEPLLRQGLADQGLTLDRLVVKQDQTESPIARDDESRQGQQEAPKRRPRQAAPDATFEVVV